MFTAAIAWLSFVVGSLLIWVVVIDSVFKITPIARLLGIRAYFSKEVLVLVSVWFVSGWYLFG